MLAPARDDATGAGGRHGHRQNARYALVKSTGFFYYFFFGFWPTDLIAGFLLTSMVLTVCKMILPKGIFKKVEMLRVTNTARKEFLGSLPNLVGTAPLCPANPNSRPPFILFFGVIGLKDFVNAAYFVLNLIYIVYGIQYYLS